MTARLGNFRLQAAEAGGRAGQARQAGQAGQGPRAWLRMAGTAARQHWPAGVLLAAGLVLRVLTLLAYRPALFYIDTTRYLNDAHGMDPVGYKGLLRAILAVANFDAVAAVQHLLGLAMAVVIYLLLVRRGISRWLGALAIAPVLLDAYQLQIEQTIMPDTLFEALIVAGLAIAAWRPGPSWRRTVAAGIVLGTSATVAQVGEALLLPAVIYLAATSGGWRRAAGQAGTLCAAFALPILAYCAGSYLLGGAFGLSDTGVTSLYGRTAAAADCATLRLPPAERAMCPDKAQQAQGPDWLEYNQRSPIRPYYSRLPRAETNRLLADYSHAVLSQQPLRVLAAYQRDVLTLFALTRSTFPGDTPVFRWHFRTTFPYFPPHASRQVVMGEIRQYGGGAPAVWRPVAALLRSYQLNGGYTPGPLFALFTLTGLAGAAAALRRRAGQQIRLPAQACLLFAATAVSVLLASDVFEFSWRYQLPALVTLAPAGALGIGVIAAGLRARHSPGVSPPPGAPRH